MLNKLKTMLNRFTEKRKGGAHPSGGSSFGDECIGGIHATLGDVSQGTGDFEECIFTTQRDDKK